MAVKDNVLLFGLPDDHLEKLTAHIHFKVGTGLVKAF
jgi:hypothetical protein